MVLLGYWWNVWSCITQRGNLSSGIFQVNIQLKCVKSKYSAEMCQKSNVVSFFLNMYTCVYEMVLPM